MAAQQLRLVSSVLEAVAAQAVLGLTARQLLAATVAQQAQTTTQEALSLTQAAGAAAFCRVLAVRAEQMQVTAA